MTETDPIRERELTEPVSLTLPRGDFNPAAAGWARQPIVDTTGIGRGWGRNKRWEYWGVITPTHLIGLTISHIDYAAVHELWVLDRASEQTWSQSATVIPARGVELPAVVAGPRGGGRRISPWPSMRSTAELAFARSRPVCAWICGHSCRPGTNGSPWWCRGAGPGSSTRSRTWHGR